MCKCVCAFEYACCDGMHACTYVYEHLHLHMHAYIIVYMHMWMHTCRYARICNDVDMRVYKHIRIYVCDAMPLAADTNRVRPAHRGRSKTQRPSTRNCVDPCVFEQMSRKLRSKCCYLKLNITFRNLGPPAKRSICPKILKSGAEIHQK